MPETLQPREHSQQTRSQQVRRQQVRGMLWLSALILLASAARASMHHMFNPGWWRLW